jgi:hypothetical protein
LLLLLLPLLRMVFPDLLQLLPLLRRQIRYSMVNEAIGSSDVKTCSRLIARNFILGNGTLHFLLK